MKESCSSGYVPSRIAVDLTTGCFDGWSFEYGNELAQLSKMLLILAVPQVRQIVVKDSHEEARGL